MVSNKSGSRRAVCLNGVRAVFDEPHGRKHMGRGMAGDVQAFLLDAGALTQKPQTGGEAICPTT